MKKKKEKERWGERQTGENLAISTPSPAFMCTNSYLTHTSFVLTSNKLVMNSSTASRVQLRADLQLQCTPVLQHFDFGKKTFNLSNP